MKNKVNIEAEGNELVLQNQAGDVVVIPKYLRNEVVKHLKNGGYAEIDRIVSTLPSMKDYAEDGTLFPSAYIPPQREGLQTACSHTSSGHKPSSVSRPIPWAR